MKFTAKDVMSKQVVSIRQNATVDQAMALLLEHQVSGLPVVDTHDQLVGIVSERDLLELLFQNNSQSFPVSRYISQKVITVGVNDSLWEVTDLFLLHQVRRLPVIDDQRHVVGVIARRDVIGCIRGLRQAVHRELATLE